MAQVKVTLIHSVAHRQPTQRRTVKANKFSASAVSAIEAAGGKTEVM